MAQILPDGTADRTVLGPDLDAGQKLQCVVPAGRWFGAYPEPGTEFTLAGCTVSPGFDFADFELAKRFELLRQFPQARELIEKLTE